VIFRGASIGSTDILVLLIEMTDSLGLQIPDELESFQDSVDYLTSLACTMVTVGLLITIISVLTFGKINLAIQWKQYQILIT